MICVVQKSEAPLAGGADAKQSTETTCIVPGQDQDGTAPYYATRWGLIQPLDSLDDAEAFLRRIGGAS